MEPENLKVHELLSKLQKAIVEQLEYSRERSIAVTYLETAGLWLKEAVNNKTEREPHDIP